MTNKNGMVLNEFGKAQTQSSSVINLGLIFRFSLKVYLFDKRFGKILQILETARAY